MIERKKALQFVNAGEFPEIARLQASAVSEAVWLYDLMFTVDTQLGVFDSISNGVVNVARAKDAWIPLGGNVVVVSQYAQEEFMESFGFGKPENN